MERNIIANKGNLINSALLATQKSKFAKVWMLKTCPIILLSSVITAWKASIFGVSFCIQSECGKIRTRKTLTTDTFHAANVSRKPSFLTFSCIIVKNSQTNFTNLLLQLLLPLKSSENHMYEKNNLFIFS